MSTFDSIVELDRARRAALKASAPPKPARRSHAHIQGDLKAATREVERLQAELAAVLPEVLTVSSVYGTNSLQVRPAAGHKLKDHVILTSYDALLGRAFEAGELRDWLNYYFPKEA